MTEKTRKDFDFNSVNFLWFIWKWKWVIAIAVIAAGLLAAIFSGPRFITPMFKSVVILFPTSTNSVSKALMDEIPGSKQDIMAFGEEAEAEQMLQILNSSEIRDRIIQKYDLRKHYKIRPQSKYAIT
ncbi:MAG: Wzz/FepE/Etk N-terminal domain-containing protein, partial [Bacteroidales bacterium]